jgi:hypothetical protein
MQHLSNILMKRALSNFSMGMAAFIMLNKYKIFEYLFTRGLLMHIFCEKITER